MSYRCTNSFAYGENVYGQGRLVADGDPILNTHGGFFARVDEPVKGGETASAAPGDARNPAPGEPTEAEWLEWLAAEEAHEAALKASKPTTSTKTTKQPSK